MEVINEIQLEVTQIAIFNNNLAGKKTVKRFKRLIFMNDIKDVAEYCYFLTGGCYNCSAVTFRDGSWFKISEDYNDLKRCLIDWYKDEIAKEMQREQK